MGSKKSFGASQEDGVDLVLVGTDVMGADAVGTVTAEHPETKNVVWDHSRDLPSVAYLNFRAKEGSFLVGAAATLESRMGIVGKSAVLSVPVNSGGGASEEAA